MDGFTGKLTKRVLICCNIITCELFPERWFDLILVLRAKTDVLFDRLTERGYSEKKRGENLEAEIMQVHWMRLGSCMRKISFKNFHRIP